MNYQQIMQIAYCNKQEVLELTYDLCKKAIQEGVPGDFCEAGVGAGAHGIVMREASIDHKIYMMDSYEGISEHGPEDKEWTEAHGVREKSDPRKSGGITVHGLQNVQNHLNQWFGNLDRFVFVKGWFIDTLPKLTDEKFSVLRLDCDLYSPYQTTLEYLYPRLSIEGYLIVDDLSLSGARQALEEYGFNLDHFSTINEGTIGYIKKIK